MTFFFSCKLVDTKASNISSLNLLHVIAGTTRRQFPRLLEFLEDLKDIEQASRIMASLNDMVQQYSEMRKGLKDLDLELGTKWQPEDVELNEDEDHFRSTMTKYKEEASLRFEDLKTLYLNMDAGWKDVMIYYGENPKVMRPDDFFSTFARFVAAWKVKKKKKTEAKETKLFLGRGCCRNQITTETRKRREKKT